MKWFQYSEAPIGAVALFLLCAIAAMALISTVAGASDLPNTLTVEITGIGNRGGMLHVGVYTREKFNSGPYDPVLQKTVPARTGSRKVTFVGLKSGPYAIKVVQDVNKNAKADHTMFGSRREPVGYSRNYSHLKKPAFRDARFYVTKGDNRIRVRMY